MAKRSASSDINHDNWDQELEPEEQGTFKTASNETLQRRILKTAKRRLKPSENSDTGKGLFSSFTGFKPTAPTSTDSSNTNKPFGFLAASSNKTTSSTMPTNGATTAPKVTVTPEQQYFSNLQLLNRSVSDWIKTHVDTNPVCILTPVFNDYEKHLKKIQEERNVSEKSNVTAVSSAPISFSTTSFVSSSSTSGNKYTIDLPTATDSIKKTFKFTDTSAKTSEESDTNKQASSFFGSKESMKSPMSQGSGASKPAVPSIFSSIKSDSAAANLLSKPDPASLMVNPFLKKPEEKPTTFSNGSTPSITKTEEEEEESDEPPKVEFTPVQEEGAVFSTRCKVFVKKDNNYKDRGVGTLFIKKVNEEKHQLLVRAETVLGNILVNVLLSSQIPTQRMGKNNVMLVCLPTPQDPPPPTTVLLRVKTASEADDLLATLNKYKL